MKIRVAQMCMLRWISAHNIKDTIRNEGIKKGLKVADSEGNDNVS